MASRQSNRKPSFFWQAALILLPVMVLAAVGFVSLRQDRLLAQKEAEERAREIADDLVSKAWQELMTTNGEGHAFQVDGEGNLVFPPPVAAFPEPKPLKLADLNATQLRLWQTAQGAESEQEKGSSGMQAYRDFLDSNPPSEFAAMAEYSLGMLLVANGQPKEAAKSFLTVIANYPDAMGESGLPLAPLAELRWLELTEFGAFSPAATNRSTSGSFDLRGMRRDSIRTLSASAEITNATKIQPSFDSFCSNLVYHPSPLSPYLLQTALKEFVPGTDFSDKVHPNTNRVWLGLWREHEFSRGLYEGARRSLMSPPRLFWFREDGEPWLATRMEKLRISCESESQVNRRLAALLPAERGIPDYLGVEVEIAGRSLGGLASDLRPWKEVNYAGKGGGVRKQFLSDFPVSMIAANAPRPPLLASAIHSENGAELMRVNVFLTSPDQLFKRQTTRTFWFGSLIAVSAGAALVGLLMAWRAFHSQQLLSEMKSNFVSSVSHELRAPIASVRLLAESLEKGKIQEPQKQVEYFRFIGQECRRLSGLIQNVLDFSRIEQGRKQYEFEPTDMMALVRETVALMQTYAVEKEVKLRFDAAEIEMERQKLELCVDSRAIQQALINLMDNAIKHSAKGGEVVVGLEKAQKKNEHEQEDQKEVRIWVEDKGPGIPLEEQERIFERFYRIGSELRRETQGVGIGLSIVKHVVEAHGGRVLVESAPGKGSKFTIELPVQNSKLE